MLLAGEAIYISSKTGKKKDNTDWFACKFLDDDADEFFNIYLDEKLYRELYQLPKRTPVVLTMNLTPGQTYFSLENIEIVNN